jgi:hypothetical protein
MGAAPSIPATLQIGPRGADLAHSSSKAVSQKIIQNYFA